MALLGATIGSYHTLRDWGLYLKVGSPKIGDAEVDEQLVQITGSDTMLNLTQALDGKIHYKKRTITMELLCTAPKANWEDLRARINNALHGRWLQCVFDSDPSWYWEGLWKVSMTRSRLSCTFTITGTCNPFKKSIADGTTDWMWDTFNFETDVIRDYRSIALPANKAVSVKIIGAPRTAAVYFKRSETTAAITLKLGSTAVGTLAKSTEWQYLEGLDLPDDATSTLVFTASAASSITIKYLGASL